MVYTPTPMGYDYELPPTEIFLDEAGTIFPPRSRSEPEGGKIATVEDETETAVSYNAETPAHGNLRAPDPELVSQTADSGKVEATETPKAPRPKAGGTMFPFHGFSHSVATQESRDELVVIPTTTSLEKLEERQPVKAEDSSRDEAKEAVQRVISVIRSECSSEAKPKRALSAESSAPSQELENDEGGDHELGREVEHIDSAIEEQNWYDSCGVSALFGNKSQQQEPSDSSEDWVRPKPSKDDAVPFDEDPEPEEISDRSSSTVQKKRCASADSTTMEELSKELVLAQVGDQVVRQSLFDKNDDLLEAAPSDEVQNISPREFQQVDSSSQSNTCCGGLMYSRQTLT